MPDRKRPTGRLRSAPESGVGSSVPRPGSGGAGPVLVIRAWPTRRSRGLPRAGRWRTVVGRGAGRGRAGRLSTPDLEQQLRSRCVIAVATPALFADAQAGYAETLASSAAREQARPRNPARPRGGRAAAHTWATTSGSTSGVARTGTGGSRSCRKLLAQPAPAATAAAVSVPGDAAVRGRSGGELPRPRGPRSRVLGRLAAEIASCT